MSNPFNKNNVIPFPKGKRLPSASNLSDNKINEFNNMQKTEINVFDTLSLEVPTYVINQKISFLKNLSTIKRKRLKTSLNYHTKKLSEMLKELNPDDPSFEKILEASVDNLVLKKSFEKLDSMEVA